MPLYVWQPAPVLYLVFSLKFEFMLFNQTAFPVSAANLWNSLPAQLTSAPSLTVFWQRLKTFLFRCSCPDLII